ncbi:MAG: hypothetical protein K2K25_01250 [Muribaculaceae bacterium]|nr:hypothetical protein [Muribaculaceae bacterium]
MRLDLNRDSYEEPGLLDAQLEKIFRKMEDKYEVTDIAGSYATRFQTIIETAHEKTGK